MLYSQDRFMTMPEAGPSADRWQCLLTPSVTQCDHVHCEHRFCERIHLHNIMTVVHSGNGSSDDEMAAKRHNAVQYDRRGPSDARNEDAVQPRKHKSRTASPAHDKNSQATQPEQQRDRPPES